MKEEEMKIMKKNEIEDVKEEDMNVMNDDEIEVMRDDNMKIKKNVAAGVSSGLGAALGAAAGTIWAEPVHASNTIGHEERQDNHLDQHHNGQSDQHHNGQSGQHQNGQQNQHQNGQQNQHQNTQEDQHPNTQQDQHQNTQQDQHQVEVVSYETHTNSEGKSEDVAVVLEDGHFVKYVDENQDGWADVKIDDANGNGIYEDDEFHKLTDQLINMEEFGKTSEVADLEGGLADLDPDYTNNANIEEYMA